LAGGNGVAGFKITRTVATPLCGSAVRDTRGCNDTNGLPQREESNKESTVLRDEFQSDGGIDGDVSPETNTGEKVDTADCTIVVLGSSLV